MWAALITESRKYQKIKGSQSSESGKGFVEGKEAKSNFHYAKEENGSSSCNRFKKGNRYCCMYRYNEKRRSLYHVNEGDCG